MMRSDKTWKLIRITFSPDSMYAYPVLECGGECERFCLLYNAYDSLIKGKTLFDEEELNYIKEEDAFSRASLFGMRSLSCAPSTQNQMILKLRKKGFSADVAQKAAEYFALNGYIDEKAQAKAEVSSCLKKKYGPIKIKARLNEKGFPKNIVSKWMIKLEDYDFSSACLSLARSRHIENPYDKTERDKAYAYLIRCGYTHECVKSVISKLYSI